MTIKKFYELEDNDLMKYVALTGQVNGEIDIAVYDDEDKFCMYRNSTRVFVNQAGKPYTKRSVEEYIIYDKATKKVRMSKSTKFLYTDLLQYFFYDHELILMLKVTPSKTLYKKIIEGSISTIGDFVSYVRSYSLKKKELSLSIVKKFMLHNVFLLRAIEDPENIQSLRQIQEVIVPAPITMGNIFTFKMEDIGKQQERYDKWANEQSSKLDAGEGW